MQEHREPFVLLFALSPFLGEAPGSKRLRNRLFEKLQLHKNAAFARRQELQTVKELPDQNYCCETGYSKYEAVDECTSCMNYFLDKSASFCPVHFCIYPAIKIIVKNTGRSD